MSLFASHCSALSNLRRKLGSHPMSRQTYINTDIRSIINFHSIISDKYRYTYIHLHIYTYMYLLHL